MVSTLEGVAGDNNYILAADYVAFDHCGFEDFASSWLYQANFRNGIAGGHFNNMDR
jgi:hypothetical protein